jgi:hypothetical protein
MFSGIRENLSPTIAAAATLLIAFSVVAADPGVAAWAQREAEDPKPTFAALKPAQVAGRQIDTNQPRSASLSYNARHRDSANRCAMQPYAIAPSILSADFARLGEDVDKVWPRVPTSSTSMSWTTTTCPT